MKYVNCIRKTVPCPECGHLNRVLFYVLDLVSVRACDYCGQVVQFKRPMEIGCFGERAHLVVK